jgi:transposase
MREKLFTLTRSQREAMWRRFKQTDDRRIAERLHAMLLLDAGQNAPSVCAILQIHPNTLKRWVKTFVTGGADALTTLTYVPAAGTLTTVHLAQFRTWLDAEVRSTAEAIAWVEAQFGVTYTDSGMVNRLKRLDYRLKQPVRVPAKANPEAQAAWVATYAKKGGFDGPGQGLLS